jgi:hypothetical protein
MCGADVNRYGRIVCDKCHEQGRLALIDHQKRQQAIVIPQYERP